MPGPPSCPPASGSARVPAVNTWTRPTPSAILSIGRVAMRVIWEGHLAGEFHGYKGGRVYELSDGSRWCQQSNTDEPVYRERPKARLLQEASIGKTWLDVEGTSAIVWVEPDRGMRSWGYGAYSPPTHRSSLRIFRFKASNSAVVMIPSSLRTFATLTASASSLNPMERPKTSSFFSAN